MPRGSHRLVRRRISKKRRGISGTLLAVVALVPLALVLDFAFIFVSFPNALEYVIAIDVPVLLAVVGVILLSRRRKAARDKELAIPQTTVMDKLKNRNGGRKAPRSGKDSVPLDEAEEETADVFLGETDTQKFTQQANQALQLMKAMNMDLGVSPIREVEAKEQLAVEPEPLSDEEAKSEKAQKPRGKPKDYVQSPDKLKVPAFVCRCGHPHRFVCLTCGTTLDQAVKKTKTHWVEWVPEMGAMP